jgi:hypothetical protein
MNDFPPPNEEMIAKPLSDRKLNELMDEASTSESKSHTANNRQPRELKMEFHENGWNSRRNEWMEEINGVRCVSPIQHKTRYASEQVFH